MSILPCLAQDPFPEISSTIIQLSRRELSTSCLLQLCRLFDFLPRVEFDGESAQWDRGLQYQRLNQVRLLTRPPSTALFLSEQSPQNINNEATVTFTGLFIARSIISGINPANTITSGERSFVPNYVVDGLKTSTFTKFANQQINRLGTSGMFFSCRGFSAKFEGGY